MGKNVNELLASLGGRRKQKAKGLPKRTGKRKGKIALYYTGAYLRNKLRRILRRNGLAAATAWASTHEADAVLRRLRG